MPTDDKRGLGDRYGIFLIKSMKYVLSSRYLPKLNLQEYSLHYDPLSEM